MSAYTLSTGVVLGAGKTGLAIGYTLLDVNNNVVSAFTTTNVFETSVPGNYSVTGGISVPESFQGRIVWGISGSPLAEIWINPVEVDINFLIDSILSRSVSTAQGTASTYSLVELILAALHSNTNQNVLTVQKTDGTTFNLRTLSVNPDAQPVIGIN